MTYCVAMRLNKGLIFMSDTRTNAGVDNISRFRKMYTWEEPGERVITVLTAGNLATSQAVISVLDERTKAPKERRPSLLEAPTMFQVANIIGDTLKEVIKTQKMTGPESEADFGATMIVGGEIAGMGPRLFLIYPEGNFIEAGEETPFFQTGETKYGRPIILRAYNPNMSFEDAVKLLSVSFDSTLKANLSVGMPLDLQVCEAGACRVTHRRRIEENDPYFTIVSRSWGDALKLAFQSLPDFAFDD
ncbi:MAG TPA: proteasome-type protease [Hyphomonas sp.]|nr:proteasome-type protease [Hyphomonas sp.]HRX74798.1 proteasome-type protease [Hyphomonas sp.]